MPSSRKQPLKTHWTWDEWLASRGARREATSKVWPGSIRRSHSSSDRRLRKAFAGRRGPEESATGEQPGRTDAQCGDQR